VTEAKRIVAVYCRVSSDDQRNRETIKTQIAAIKRYLKANPHLAVFRWYIDDGVSGTIPLSMRPQGKELLLDAAAGRFTAILVLSADRLGREEIELLQYYATCAQLGLDLIGVTESLSDRVLFGIKAILSGDERRKFLARSAEGMRRAAEEGRYTGGIVSFGLRVEGTREHARLVPDERHFWGEVSAAEIVCQIYGWLLQAKSCYWIADHLNDLGVPTAYVKDGRLLKDSQGRRTKATQGKWRPGRICNLVKNPVYKGQLAYGRRSKRDRDVIIAPITPLVPADIWEAAQRALVANRIMRRRTQTMNILRSVVVCGIDGLHYSSAVGRDVAWLRCNGQTAHRGKIQGRCPAKSIKLHDLAPVVWEDIERFLRHPGEIIEELAAERNDTSAAAASEAERLGIEAALASLPREREAVIGLRRRGKITDEECDVQLDDIARIEEQQRRRLAELVPVEAPQDQPDEDLLAEIRARLDEGLDDQIRQEIVQHLVRRIVVHTEFEGARKRARIVVEYRFPAVAETDTGTRAGQNYSNPTRVVQL
jgi:site-specific DNA recombinase